MDLVTQTSLEALLMKATSSSNQNIDTAAVEAFCTLVNKEKDGAYIGVKVIANRLHSGVEKEVLQTLNILDSCMSRCGSHFQSEVGKFRFLNEMIKLVSPKYLGCQTPILVKQKVLQLLYVWTLDFPKESKIKEAYDMLRKQGVIREIPNPNVALETNVPKKRISPIFQDEEKSKILQKLLQSKDPEDIQAANWLIKSMVKEDEKRVELKSRKISELESMQNNIRLLKEMLDSYVADTTSKDEMDLIKELYQSCERLRPNLAKLASETQQNEDLLSDIIQMDEELTQVVKKYQCIIVDGDVKTNNSADLSLLSLDLMNDCSNVSASDEIGTKPNIDVLCELFNSPEIPNSELLKPQQVKIDNPEKNECKLSALDDLDILSEHLMKENLKSDQRKSFNSNFQDKVPMNLLTKKPDSKPNNHLEPQRMDACRLDFDLSLLTSKPIQQSENKNTENASASNGTADDFLVDISVEEKSSNDVPMLKVVEKKTELNLKDITIDLKDVKPSSLKPVTILDKNQVNVTIHHARDRPREDVRVFVVTTVNKNEMILSNYLFQAVVPKSCKLKVQSPSATDLPAFNPFLPPSAITQIMIIANPESVKLNLKFVLSYTMDDETITEMGDIADL